MQSVMYLDDSLTDDEMEAIVEEQRVLRNLSDPDSYRIVDNTL